MSLLVRLLERCLGFLVVLSFGACGLTLSSIADSKITPRAMTESSGYFELGEVEVTELSSDPLADLENSDIPINPLTTLGLVRGGELELQLDMIINMGKKIWAIIEAGKPTAEVNVSSANALPQGSRDWAQLQGWETPQVRRYRVSMKNGYGMTVVDFTYRVQFTPGGNFEGRGRFLTNIVILPEDLYVAWAWNFSATASVPNVTNAGNIENPIAAAELLLDFKIETPLFKQRSTRSYYVRGDGMFVDLQNRM